MSIDHINWVQKYWDINAKKFKMPLWKDQPPGFMQYMLDKVKDCKTEAEVLSKLQEKN